MRGDTRRRVRAAVVVLLLLMLKGTPGPEASAQAVPGLWTKYAANPVFTGGATGSWDEVEAFDPSVILDGMTYKMWYTGSGSSGPRRIGYATSSDGIEWAKFAGNPVFSEGPPASWDEDGARWGSVLLDGAVYKMWYTGRDASGTNRIGYATSLNGTDWTKDENNPVFDVGAPGSWEDKHVLYPAVIKDGGTYKMWYTGWNITTETVQIGYATSNDGISWTRYSGNPILTWGPPASWDETAVYAASVLLDAGIYHMWYSGADGGEWQIGYATSPDGITWTKHPENPVITEGGPGAFDSDGADYPCVVLSSNTYRMWYSGFNNADALYRIGYAYAPALTERSYIPIAMRSY